MLNLNRFNRIDDFEAATIFLFQIRSNANSEAMALAAEQRTNRKPTNEECEMKYNRTYAQFPESF